MEVECYCGSVNSAFDPRCLVCGALVVENPPSATPPPIQPRPGMRLGAYTIESTLGVGSSGEVFRVCDADNRSFALKHLSRLVGPDSSARARFMREVHALRDVDHPHIGRIVDVFAWEEIPCILLELCEGPTLRQATLTAPLPFEVAARVLHQLASALGCLHEAKWIHRDVKPENIILQRSRSAHATLLDLGFARRLEGEDAAAQLTMTGVFVGSTAYAAPEQLMGEALGPWTDWWAVGVVAYELFSGKRPFDGPTRAAVASRVLSSEPPASCEGAGSEVSAAISRLLSKNPKERPSDWREVVALLPPQSAMA